MFFKAVGDVLEEDKAEDDVLIFRCIHIAAQLVRGKPELRFKANVGGVAILCGGLGTGHESAENSRRRRKLEGRSKI